MGRARISNHSWRSGGETLTFAVGFDIEIIERWGRWLSPTSNSYIWRGGRVLSHIGRGTLNSSTFPGRVGEKRGISQVAPSEWGRYQRLVETSAAMSGALRRRQLPTMDGAGCEAIKEVCDLPRLREMHTTMGDIRLIAPGEDDNRKRRFDLSHDSRCIRCAQCHSAGSVVRPTFSRCKQR